ncbi:hypothetical protein Efla_003205 [Eimeria flavescens]
MRGPSQSRVRAAADKKSLRMDVRTKLSREGRAAADCSLQGSETTAPATPTGAVLSATSVDSVLLLGAEAYLLTDEKRLQRQRTANDKIRALLCSVKAKNGPAEGQPSLPPSPRPDVTPAPAAAAATAAATLATGKADAEERSATASPARAQGGRDGPPLPLPEFALLPELPGTVLPSAPRPLRPWQQEQHEQLLLLQQRQLQQLSKDGTQKLQQQESGESLEESLKNGPQPQRQRRETAGAPAARVAAAVAAAGAAATAAGADFFGRLHAECMAVLRLLRPSEEENRRKREAAARVRAVCRLLWRDCSVEIFGSSCTGLSLPGSDLDVCVFADRAPPLRDHFACSRCLCCNSCSSGSDNRSSSSNSNSNSRRTNSKQLEADRRVTCGKEAADGGCCCANVPRKHRGGNSSSGLCCSSCSHGTPKGFQKLLLTAQQHTAAAYSNPPESAVSKIRGFTSCLHELNQAAAAAKFQGVDVGQGAGRFADSIKPVFSARVPICKFRDAETGVAVDLSIDQPSAVFTSLYIRHKLKEFSLLHPLILLNKMALRHWRLNEPFKGGVGSYLLFVLCLHYLQNNAYLRDAKKHRHLNLGHLLFHFLNYFSHQFDAVASSIRQAPVQGSGRLVPRSRVSWKGEPELSAESPLDPLLNLGRSAYQFERVRAAWKEAFVRLASRLKAEFRQDTKEGQWTAAAEEPLLASLFGSDTWAERLGKQFCQASIKSDSGEVLTALRPGLWVPKDVARAAEAAVDCLVAFSSKLSRVPASIGKHNRNEEGVVSESMREEADNMSSLDSDASCRMKRRREWRQNRQKKQRSSSMPTNPNVHIIFDSSESDSATASENPPPVRGFVSSRSGSPSPPSSKERRAFLDSRAASPATAKAAEADSSAQAFPPMISVEDSSSSDSTAKALRRREANKLKRKRRKQRQSAQARKQMQLRG